MSDFLRRSGYRVVEAANGREGIFAAESERSGVVILDREMPGTNGLEVLSFFRLRRPKLPIIFITAFGGREDEDESRRRGAWPYIDKPFRAASFYNDLVVLGPEAVFPTDHERTHELLRA